MFFLIIVGGVLLGDQISFADVLYLKNGNQVEGVAEETSNGVWVQGILFNKDEIDRIEKSQNSSNNNNSWWNLPLFDAKPSEENQVAAPAGLAASSNNTNQGMPNSIDSNAIMQKMVSMMLGGNGNQKDFFTTAEGMSKQNADLMQAAMEQAFSLQKQAQTKQMQIMQEIRCAEEGLCEGVSDNPTGMLSEEAMQKNYQKTMEIYQKMMGGMTDGSQGNLSGQTSNSSSGSSYRGTSRSSSNSSYSSGNRRHNSSQRFSTRNIGRELNIGPSEMMIGPQDEEEESQDEGSQF